MPTPLDIEKELDQVLATSLRTYCQKLAFDHSSHRALLVTPEAKAAQMQDEIQDEVYAYKKRCTDGFESCIKQVEVLAAIDSSIDLDRIKRNLQSAFAKLDSSDTIKDLAEEAVSGISWGILIGVEDRTLQALYRGAEQIFRAKRYAEAESAFCFLASLDTTQYAFWLGLGHASFHQGKTHEAAKAYMMASLCDPFSIWPHIYNANCFEAIGDFAQAVVCLHEAENAYIQGTFRDKDLEEVMYQRIVSLKNR